MKIKKKRKFLKISFKIIIKINNMGCGNASAAEPEKEEKREMEDFKIGTTVEVRKVDTPIRDNYLLGHLIGKGYHGEVRRAKHRITMQPRAIKCL